MLRFEELRCCIVQVESTTLSSFLASCASASAHMAEAPHESSACGTASSIATMGL